MSSSSVNLSLQPHLKDTLQHIAHLAPSHLDISKYTEQDATLVPYDVLLHLSRWTRSDEGREALKAHDLNPHDYSMIALQAGATTSPERKFGSYEPPKDPEQVAAEQARERKAITYLANAVLSVGGVGFGSFYAAQWTGWREEWRVLFALFVSIAVAFAEGGLYLIWQWRKSLPPPTKTRRLRSARHKKVDPPLSTADGDAKDQSGVDVDTDRSATDSATATPTAPQTTSSALEVQPHPQVNSNNDDDDGATTLRQRR